MKKVQIKLVTIEDIRNFVNILAKYNIDLDLNQGRYIVDARSLMGIFSLDLLKPVDFVVNSEDENIVNSVLGDIKEWIV
ncbi:MAG: HPr family phosphocarrier protein [Oscillospiraceae bacterium]|nr:HPr family phosphocarrier protein [Oscillospiraceae bacterium]